MAYTEKYYISYCDSFGVPCRLSILENEYVGGAIELTGQKLPFEKVYAGTSDFKFEPIRPSQGVCSIVFGDGTGADLDELWTADERKFKVEHFIDSVLDWTGYVIPNGFQYNLKGGLYPGQLVATDGLSTLENLPFLYNDGDAYGTQDLTYNNGFEFPWVLMATEILRKLDLDLNTWIAVDVYEKSMDPLAGDNRNADPLATSYGNVKTYINDTQRKDIPYWKDANEVMNCFDVMQNLCYLFGAKVYQNKGVWRIKRINVDADYGAGDTQRYWRKYNTLSVYLGRETVNNEITIPCATVDKSMIGSSHLVSMDDVYGAFRINYKFQLLRIGDSPISLIPNGDFSIFDNSSKLAAPEGWFRWRDGNNWHMGLKPVDISAESPGGYTTGIVLGDQVPALGTSKIDSAARRWNSIRAIDEIGVTKGDVLYWNMWLKSVNYIPNNNMFGVMFRIQLKGGNGENYFLQNVTDVKKKSFKELGWRKDDTDEGTKGDTFINIAAHMGEGWNDADNEVYKWREFKLILDEVPESGSLIFDIHGLAKVYGKSTDHFPKFQTNYAVGPRKKFHPYYPVKDFIDEGGPVGRVLMTGLELGRIPDPGEFAESQDFVYENADNYSLEVKPIEVLNGDVLDPQHTSRIIVPSNVSDFKNFWDTIDNKYGGSSLGLITCKSIMNLYIKPFMILDGNIKAQGIDIDTRFEFEAIPGRFFAIQRGTFDQKNNYLSGATFYEVSDIAIAPGGFEGQNTIEPVFIMSGRSRCVQEDNINTGFLEVEYVDTNQNSETFGENYWIHVFTTNLEYCPIGEPDRYLWGTDDVSLDYNNLTNNPFFIDPDNDKSISVEFSNPGGEYIYFMHLGSLGVVEGVNTEAQAEIISDFQYLTDITINGYLYRVLRQNYITTQFENLSINFIFQ